MTKQIAAAPATRRRHAEKGSVGGYLLGSGLFLGGLVGLFSLAGFTL